MKHYHIVFYIQDTDFMAEGRNYQAHDPMKAYNDWLREFPAAVFVALYINNRL